MDTSSSRCMPKGFLVLLMLASAQLALALRYDYGDGSFYIGQVDGKGRPSGRGKFYNTTGALEYEGDFLGGAPDGKGVWHGRTGESLEGTFARGKPNGYGVLRLKNGDMVEGEFRGGFSPEGKAVLQRADGERIEGEFRHGMPHGRIVWTSAAEEEEEEEAPSSVVLEGNFRMGRPHGQGKLFDRTGNLLYEGQFVKGRPVDGGGFFASRSSVSKQHPKAAVAPVSRVMEAMGHFHFE